MELTLDNYVHFFTSLAYLATRGGETRAYMSTWRRGAGLKIQLQQGLQKKRIFEDWKIWAPPF
jgi:hypothetical protein